jgi:hypothetical protein
MLRLSSDSAQAHTSSSQVEAAAAHVQTLKRNRAQKILPESLWITHYEFDRQPLDMLFEFNIPCPTTRSKPRRQFSYLLIEYCSLGSSLVSLSPRSVFRSYKLGKGTNKPQCSPTQDSNTPSSFLSPRPTASSPLQPRLH